MEVILLQDVPKIGRKNDLKQVKEGFGRNFLLKRGLAIEATPQTKTEYEKRLKLNTAENTKNQELKKLVREKLKNIVLVIKAKASEKGHLFEGIKKEIVLKTLARDHKIILDDGDLLLDKPIKLTGETKIPLHGGGELVVRIIAA